MRHGKEVEAGVEARTGEVMNVAGYVGPVGLSEAVAIPSAEFEGGDNPLTLEDPDGGTKEHGSIVLAAREIGAIVKAYKDHDDVQHELFRRRRGFNTSRRGQVDQLGAYLAEIDAYPLLDDEAAVLAADVQAGLSLYREHGSLEGLSETQTGVLVRLTIAQQLLFLCNLGLVVSIAKGYWPVHGMTEMEVIQEGNVGLTRGIAGFEPERGLQFSTYATWWIKKTIRDAIASQSRTIRIPRYLHEAYVAAKKAVRTLQQESDHGLTVAEMAGAAGLSIPEYRELMRVGDGYVESFSQPISTTDGDTELGEAVANPAADMESKITRLSGRTVLAEAIRCSGLTDRRKAVLGLRFGLPPEIVGDVTVLIKGTGEYRTYRDLYQEIPKHSGEGAGDGLLQREIAVLLGVSPQMIGKEELHALSVLQCQVDPDEVYLS